MSTPSAIITFYNIYDMTPDYRHTRYFATGALRDAYYLRHKAFDVTPTQAIRIDDGEVKIPMPLKELHDYTYMSIQNSRGTNASKDHKYYCFIIDMDYVSDMCTLVKYKVDVMQTFCMDGLFSSSMPNDNLVIRCHNSTDEIGDNLVTEPFNVGDYVESSGYIATNTLQDYRVVVAVCSTQSITLQGTSINLKPRQYFFNRYYTGTTYLVFDVTTTTGSLALEELMNIMSTTPQEVVGIYSVPSAILGSITDNYVLNVANPISSSSVSYTQGRGESQGFEGYIPKNKKLFTSPFTMLRVTNYEGEKIDLSFELFYNPNACEFEMDGTVFGEPSVSIYPRDYGFNVNAQNHQTNYDYSVSCDNYAYGTWQSDIYGSYLRKNGTITAARMLMGTIGTMVASSMLTGGVGAVASTGTALVTASTGANMQLMDSALGMNSYASPSLANISRQELTDIGRGGGYALYNGWKFLSEAIRAKNTGNTTYGTGTKGTTAQINNHKGIYFKTIKIRKYLAEQIDNFFTMFGYSQNKLMNIGSYLQNHTRPYYSYIQCDNFSLVNGAVENKYKVEISKIMNNGITFWFQTSSQTEHPIGKYTNIDNSPITT